MRPTPRSATTLLVLARASTARARDVLAANSREPSGDLRTHTHVHDQSRSHNARVCVCVVDDDETDATHHCSMAMPRNGVSTASDADSPTSTSQTYAQSQSIPTKARTYRDSTISQCGRREQRAQRRPRQCRAEWLPEPSHRSRRNLARTA
jgi:hypothetical protein